MVSRNNDNMIKPGDALFVTVSIGTLWWHSGMSLIWFVVILIMCGFVNAWFNSRMVGR